MAGGVKLSVDGPSQLDATPRGAEGMPTASLQTQMPRPQTGTRALAALSSVDPHAMAIESRLARMQAEIRLGFDALSEVSVAAAVFGARLSEDEPEYELARRLTRDLGERGIGTITGGGPGIMEAANRGARDSGATSVGLNIVMAASRAQAMHAEDMNQYVDLGVTFHYFFARKITFVHHASAFVVLPGGIGTLDELFELLMLIRSGKTEPPPVFLVGAEYWTGFIDWMRAQTLRRGMIAAEDLELITVADRTDEVVAGLTASGHRAPAMAEQPSTAVQQLLLAATDGYSGEIN